jgi:hypothetical protein
MKVLKIVLIVIGGIIALLFILFFIYWMVKRQGVIESFDVGDPELVPRVLIASQGSDFKNALVDSLTAHLQEQQVFIKVMDVTTLSAVNEDEYDAMVFIHTTEQWKLQSDVKAYLDRTNDLDKVILVSTSGSGDWKTKEYDVETITSASTTEEFSTLIPLILRRLDAILGKPAPQRQE